MQEASGNAALARMALDFLSAPGKHTLLIRVDLHSLTLAITQLPPWIWNADSLVGV